MGEPIVVPDRPAPVITEATEAFWTGGARGELLIARCRACGHWMHPPSPMCRRCRGRDIRPEATSGRGAIWSYTVNRYPWVPGVVPPYVLAEVELAEQPGLRLLAEIVGVGAGSVDGVDDAGGVAIGMAVTVRFQRAGEAWVPVFAP